MGTGADQAKWLRERLTQARGKKGQPGFISGTEVAERVALILRKTPAWKKVGKTTLTKQTISNWESDEVQPGIDEMAAWARAVNLRLWVDVYDPVEKSVETRVRVDVLRIAHELELLNPDDFRMIRDMVLRLRTQMPKEEPDPVEEE